MKCEGDHKSDLMQLLFCLQSLWLHLSKTISWSMPHSHCALIVPLFLWCSRLYFWRLMSAWELNGLFWGESKYSFHTPAAAELMMGFGKAGLDGHKAFFFLEWLCNQDLFIWWLLLAPGHGCLGSECCQGGVGECPEGTRGTQGASGPVVGLGHLHRSANHWLGAVGCQSWDVR